MKLRPDESVLIGTWKFANNEMRGDTVCERIEWLVTNELKKIASSQQLGDWETLFLDPSDGRYWERTYPQGHLQGGGPPKLQTISESEAKLKYEFPDR